MKRKQSSDGTDEVSKVEDSGIKHESRKSGGGVKLGDLIWVKLHSSSWWPAQVVDADTVSELMKPKERSVGEVLVRVYGSYIYLYVDPLESRAEFDKVLTLYNGNYDQILKESLDKDRPGSNKSEGPRGSKTSQPIGEVGPEKNSDENFEEENNLEGKEDDDQCGTRTAKQKGKSSAKSNKSAKKNAMVVDNETPLQRRVSPRLKLASKNLETGSESGNYKIQVNSATDIGRASATEHQSHSQNSDNEAGLDPKNTGKIDIIPSSPCQAVVPANSYRNISARSKKIMQRLGLMPPSGSPFIRKNQYS